MYALPAGCGGSEEKEWVYQKQLETLLYSNGYAQSTGAVYRLLKRCPAGTSPSLPLKKASIALASSRIRSRLRFSISQIGRRL